MKKFLYYILLSISLSSCLASSEKHGYMFDLSDHELLQEGVSSKETVTKLMGSPTIISDISMPESWIYYSEEVEKFLFFLPKITSRNILVITFDNTNSIKNLRKFDLSNNDEKLKFTSQYTKVISSEAGFFKSIFSNIGQVRPQ